MNWRMVVMAWVMLLAAYAAQAQYCVTLQTDRDGGCAGSGCAYFCARSAPTATSAKTMPGFSVRQRDGKVVVTGVLKNSPAYLAGVRAGDVLSAVDGTPVPFTGDSTIWTTRTLHNVELLRGSAALRTTIVSAPIVELLAALPYERQMFREAAFRSTNSTRIPMGLFLSGMSVHRDGTTFVVDSVLSRSPADLANLRPGDRFVSEENASAGSLASSDERRSVTIRLLVEGKPVKKVLQFASLSELLDATSDH